MAAINEGLPQGQALTLKRLSGTRWAERADATQALYQSYSKFVKLFEKIAVDPAFKASLCKVIFYPLRRKPKHLLIVKPVKGNEGETLVLLIQTIRQGQTMCPHLKTVPLRLFSIV